VGRRWWVVLRRRRHQLDNAWQRGLQHALDLARVGHPSADLHPERIGDIARATGEFAQAEGTRRCSREALLNHERCAAVDRDDQGCARGQVVVERAGQMLGDIQTHMHHRVAGLDFGYRAIVAKHAARFNYPII